MPRTLRLRARRQTVRATLATFVLTLAALPTGNLPIGALVAQDPAAQPAPERPKERSPRLEMLIDELRDAFKDRRQSRDDEVIAALGELVPAMRANDPDAAEPQLLHQDDEKMLLRAFGEVLTKGRLRDAEACRIYELAAEGLGAAGETGVSILLQVYDRKRFPRKPDWLPMRVKLVEQIGNVQSDKTREFLGDLIQRSGEIPLLREAGVQLGRNGQADEKARKEAVKLLSQRLSGFEMLSRESPVDQSSRLNIGREHAIQVVDACQRPWCNAMADLTGVRQAHGTAWDKWYRENKQTTWPPVEKR